MTYTFSTLFPADFEDLARDLLGRELGLRFEAFGPGPDGGIDGRHAAAEASTILQAKHYAGSSFSTLAAQMKKERKVIDRLSPARYLLATSRQLSPANKATLAALIGDALREEGDIYAAGDLNGLLRKFPEVEKSHIKLWLSSTAILESVLRAAATNYTELSREEIQGKVRVYAPNPSFQGSYKRLENNHVLIISGPPGVGKTTLAEMLSYAYMGEGWRFHAIRSLDDGFATIVDSKKQIFFFDDFLGTIALDAKALAMKDSDLAKFIKRVRTTKNARFILTTRAYILEEARRVSEHLADRRLDVTKYVLDVGVYTRRIRARILYNHLLAAELPQAHVEALIEQGAISKIVDHENYNPRVVEWMTDILRVGDINAVEYPGAFLAALANPKQLWDIAFRTHIPHKCRHLLFALFFCSEYGAGISDLRTIFATLHHHLCENYRISHDPKDFEESVQILEGGFIRITGKRASFINPSFRDYLADYLTDLGMLSGFAVAAAKADWARAVWRHGTKGKLDPDDAVAFSPAFMTIAERFPELARWRRVDGNPYSLSPCDLDNSDRINLLLDWFRVSRSARFAELALAVALRPVDGFSSWGDGATLVELVRQIRDGDYFDELPNASEIATGLEMGIIGMLEGGMASDDLERISDEVEGCLDYVSENVVSAVQDAIRREFREIDSITSDIDSESTLSDHRDALKKLGPRAGISDRFLEAAISTVESRMQQLSEETEEAKSPTFTKSAPNETDKFDDEAMTNLFASLFDDRWKSAIDMPE